MRARAGSVGLRHRPSHAFTRTWRTELVGRLESLGEGDRAVVSRAIGSVAELRRRLAKASGLSAIGRFDRARELAEQVLSAAEPLGHAWLTARARLMVGGLEMNTDDLEGALESLERAYAERALPILERTRGPGHPHVAATVLSIAGAKDRLQDFAGARVGYEQALSLLEARLGPNHPDVGTACLGLGRFLARTGHPEAAVEHSSVPARSSSRPRSIRPSSA